MIITFQRTNVKGRYKVKINGRPAGEINKEDSTKKTYWLYVCSAPRLEGFNRKRHWAVRNAVLAVQQEADDLEEFFGL